MACGEKRLAYCEIKNLERDKPDLDGDLPMAFVEMEVACGEKGLACSEIMDLDGEKQNLDREMPVACREKLNLDRET